MRSEITERTLINVFSLYDYTKNVATKARIA